MEVWTSSRIVSQGRVQVWGLSELPMQGLKARRGKVYAVRWALYIHSNSLHPCFSRTGEPFRNGYAGFFWTSGTAALVCAVTAQTEVQDQNASGLKHP